LHQQVSPQYIVIVQVLVAAAQTIQALRNQVPQSVRDARTIPFITQCPRYRSTQADSPIDPPQQQQTTI
jgi:hypothetical protein